MLSLFLQTPPSLRDTSPNLGEEFLPYIPYIPYVPYKP